ncbi:hypothetical protein IEQ34_011328 [Dendrobium chrysotoxum]|uniref:Uncharacterized protein n=1 Tax=Dendrobium chrysotoxum TaxID=161865 RepID=A0AAV7GFT1_DENCH|nr:hypothetical protein IEQ34_011328 [Dendrobium chrysotoxum]
MPPPQSPAILLHPTPRGQAALQWHRSSRPHWHVDPELRSIPFCLLIAAAAASREGFKRGDESADDGDDLVVDAVLGGAVEAVAHEVQEAVGGGAAGEGVGDDEVGVAVIVNEVGEGPIPSGVRVSRVKRWCTLKGSGG